MASRHRRSRNRRCGNARTWARHVNSRTADQSIKRVRQGQIRGNSEGIDAVRLHYSVGHRYPIGSRLNQIGRALKRYICVPCGPLECDNSIRAIGDVRLIHNQEAVACKRIDRQNKLKRADVALRPVRAALINRGAEKLDTAIDRKTIRSNAHRLRRAAIICQWQQRRTRQVETQVRLSDERVTIRRNITPSVR